VQCKIRHCVCRTRQAVADAYQARSRLTKYIYICRVSDVSLRLRLSPQTIKVLETFLEAPKEWRYGYDISGDTGLKSGTLYPILMRLADRELLETSWETAEPGKPPRHMYRLTPEGQQSAREWVRPHAIRRPQRAAFGEGKS
jgi:PadR family transcriptional regulator PadR